MKLLVETILVVIIFIVSSIAIVTGISHIQYNFDKSICTVYVDGLLVYKDRCHFIRVTPVDEYLNSRQLTIFEDIKLLKVKKQYRSNWIFVEEESR